ncbi:MAG: hypothetical protein WA102_13710 [Candidatus Methanoperedens sp.]
MADAEGVVSKEIHQMKYKRIKGIIVSYVTNRFKPLNVVAKSIQTSLKKGEVNSSELMRIFSEVEKESVEAEAFIRDHSYADRKKRFEELKKILCLD